MAVVLKINGVDKTASVKMGTLRIMDRINQATDTCQFTVERKNASSYVPKINDEVTVDVDGVRAYGGVIVQVDMTREGHQNLEYDVLCKDYSHYLDRLLITERYTNTTLDAVVADLIDRYADDYGFTGTNVGGSTVQVGSIAFSELKFSQCMDKISRLTNYLWYVDYNKDIHLFAKNDEAAPFNLTDNEASSDYGKYIYDSLSIREDISQIRNSVKIRGGEAVAEERTEKLTGDGEKDFFPLANKFSEQPVVTVDGTPVEVGLDFLHLDEDNDVMWNFQQKYLRFTAGNTPGAPLSGATNINVTGTPLKPIVVNRVDSVSIAQYGLFEHVIRNDAIRSRDEALQYAQSDLQSHADKIRAGGYETYTAGLKSGQTQQLEITQMGVSEAFVIQAVTFTMVTPTRYHYRIELATVKTLTIIDYLQKLLLQDRIEVGEDETLLNFFNFTDNFTFGDTYGGHSVTTSEDYVVEQNDPGSDSYSNVALVNKSTISA